MRKCEISQEESSDQSSSMGFTLRSNTITDDLLSFPHNATWGNAEKRTPWNDE